MIDDKLIHELFDLKVPRFQVSCLGLASESSDNAVLTFITERKYIKQLNDNLAVKAVFTTSKIAPGIRNDIRLIIVDDPKWYFLKMVDYFGRNRKRTGSEISPTAKIHPTAVISSEGVTIEENVIIEPNVVIHSDVLIGRDVIIRSGSVVGAEGFEHKRTSQGILSITHNGNLIIKKDSEIGSNSNICKGFSYRDTIIGEETKIDAFVNYGHGVQCGARCIIAAAAMIAGHVTMGDDVWIGPNSTISNRVHIGSEASVTLGAVVVENITAGEKVTGNFALPHLKFIKKFAKESIQ